MRFKQLRIFCKQFRHIGKQACSQRFKILCWHQEAAGAGVTAEFFKEPLMAFEERVEIHTLYASAGTLEILLLLTGRRHNHRRSMVGFFYLSGNNARDSFMRVLGTN